MTPDPAAIPLRDNRTLDLTDSGDTRYHGDGLAWRCRSCGKEYAHVLLIPARLPGGRRVCGKCGKGIDVAKLTPRITK